MELSPANRAALAHVRSRAAATRRRDRERIARGGADAGALLAAVRAAPITLNFRPDRRLADGRSTADALAGEGVYRRRFETRISSGGLTAVPGGDRDRWEEELFGGAYRGAPAAERPRYGGLNLMRHLNGACAGFGSCHLRLRPAALERSAFVFGDSVLVRTGVATLGAFEPVPAALVERVAETGSALGRAGSGRLDAANLGEAAAWRGASPEGLQRLKYVWRMLVAYGEPA